MVYSFYTKIDFKKKILTAATLVAVLAPVSTVAATTRYPTYDSVWVYGAGGKGAFSSYYHGSKYHSATVVSRWTGASDKKYANAGNRAYATIRTEWREQVAFYYNYY